MKTCSTCHAVKPLGDFYARADRPRGMSSCKACRAENAKAYRARNLGAVRQRSLDWYASNRDKSIATTRTWQIEHATQHAAAKRSYEETNKNVIRESRRTWRKENPDIVRRNKAARRASQLCAQPVWSNRKAICAIYEDAVRISQATGVEHVVDHIVPLQSKLVCGLHVEHNLRVITKVENDRKGNRYWPDMPIDTKFQTPGPLLRAVSLLTVGGGGAPATYSGGAKP